MAEEFANGGYKLLETVGFDISSNQFPKNPAPENKFVLWDMTKSFPKEYHGTFDVVHIRLVVLALKVEQIKDVVENLVELLSKEKHSQPPHPHQQPVTNQHRTRWISPMDRHVLPQWPQDNTLR